jgi:hypothetical protein
VGLMVLVKIMSVLNNFLLQNTNLVSAQILLVMHMSDRTDEFREFCVYSEHKSLVCRRFSLDRSHCIYSYTPTRRGGTILQSPCPSVSPSVCPSVHIFVTDISASTGRNDFILDIWLWHGDLYCFSPFQVYRTSTSCLPCNLQMNEWEYS